MNCKWINVSLAALSTLSSTQISSNLETAVQAEVVSLEAILSAPSLTRGKDIPCVGRAVPGLPERTS